MGQNQSVLFNINDSLQNITNEELLKASEGLSEIEDGEVVIGEASEEAKKLFVLQKKITGDLEAISNEMEKKKPRSLSELKEAIDEVMDKFKERKDMCEIYYSLMWRAMTESLEKPNYSITIGIRKGWKIVKIPKQEMSLPIGLGIISIGGPGFALSSLFD